jgi:hypothetical protein
MDYNGQCYTRAINKKKCKKVKQMANITLTIPLPILTGSQYFKTRYRALPSGSWSSYVNRTNAAFTLTGLGTGSYQLEVILVNDDTSECAANYTGFEVADDFECIDFDATLAQTGSLYQLNITYTIPGGFTNATCGWDIIVTDATGTKTIPYSVLPVSGAITLAVQNLAMHVQVRANLCNGNYKMCFEDDISPIVPACTPLIIVKAEVIKAFTNSYALRLLIYNSVPATVSIGYSFKEISPYYPGSLSGQAGSGSFYGPPLIPGNPYLFTMFVNPNGYPGEGIQYEGTLTDICGKSHYWKTNILYG